jgi:uncharacterized membrane protein
MREPPAPPLH